MGHGSRSSLWWITGDCWQGGWDGIVDSGNWMIILRVVTFNGVGVIGEHGGVAVSGGWRVITHACVVQSG